MGLEFAKDLVSQKEREASSPLLQWWDLDLLKTFISLDGNLNAGPNSDAWGFLDAWINLLSVKSKLVSQSIRQMISGSGPLLSHSI